MGDPGSHSPAWNFFRKLDYLQLAVMSLLLVCGAVFIRSTGLQVGGENNLAFFPRQLLWIGAGLGLYWLCALIDYRSPLWRGAVLLGYFISLVLLVAVLIWGVKIFGARRWLNLPGFRLQPSELAKVTVIFTLAAFFSYAQRERISLWLTALISLSTVIVPFILIAVEPDLGSAMILVPVYAAILFCYGIKWRYIAIIGTLLLVLAAFIIVDCAVREKPLLLKNYQRDRIRVFLKPGMDRANRGHNAYQAKLAVGSGGWAGSGIGEGTQNELGFLPQTVSNNDFIFSVIAEETGFVGCFGLLLLYLLLLYSILRTAFLAPPYGRYLAVGISMIFFFHVFINVGMSIGIAPVTGLPLPLVSYGGSFTMTAMAALGVVQGIYWRRGGDED